jgi:hypothetical protein
MYVIPVIQMEQPFFAIETNVGTSHRREQLWSTGRGKEYIHFSIGFKIFPCFLSPVSEIAFPQLQKHWLWPGELRKFTDNTVSVLT